MAFLGRIAERRLPELRDIGGTVAATPFGFEPLVIELVRAGYWRSQRLVWAAPAECPPALAALQARLSDALRQRDFPVERRAFKPHVTLLRDAVAPPALSRPVMQPLRWPVAALVLACSESTAAGVRYRKLGQWPLRVAGP